MKESSESKSIVCCPVFRETEMFAELPEGVAFFGAEVVSKYLGISAGRLRNLASQAADGTVWKQCRYGKWHIAQIKILESLLTDKKMTIEEANAKWELAKMQIQKNASKFK